MLFKAIIAQAELACKITRCEPRVLKLDSPCHLIGGLHGNLAILDFFRSILWPAGPAASGMEAGTRELQEWLGRGCSCCNRRMVEGSLLLETRMGMGTTFFFL